MAHPLHLGDDRFPVGHSASRRSRWQLLERTQFRYWNARFLDDERFPFSHGSNYDAGLRMEFPNSRALYVRHCDTILGKGQSPPAPIGIGRALVLSCFAVLIGHVIYREGYGVSSNPDRSLGNEFLIGHASHHPNARRDVAKVEP